jgi:hypothetical protein
MMKKWYNVPKTRMVREWYYVRIECPVTGIIYRLVYETVQRVSNWYDIPIIGIIYQNWYDIPKVV